MTTNDKTDGGVKDLRISDTVLAFKELVGKCEIDIKDIGTAIPKKPIKKLLRFFKEIADVRSPKKIIYPLSEIIMGAFVAVLSGATTFVGIAEFCSSKKDWLKKYFNVQKVPSHDTFRRVFTLIEPGHLQKATVAFLVDNIRLIKRSFKIDDAGLRQLCVDGKTARGTGKLKGTDREVAQIQTLHVFDRKDAICIISEKINEKTNEIPVAQNILESLCLKDTVVTFDALNTQRDTINVVASRKGDYVAALKKNQGGFYEELESYFTPSRLAQIKNGNTNYYETKEKAHNCIETRRYYLSKNVSWLLQSKDWGKLKGIIFYLKHSVDINTGEITETIRYYISSLTDVILCAQAIRGHWAVENQLHWNLDVNYLEDDIEVIDRNAFQNRSLLTKMALSLTKLIAALKKKSISITKYLLGWNDTEIINAFRFLDEDIISESLANVKL